MSSSGGPRAGQPRRRAFTAEYKLAMVAEYERATAAGERGALLRREGFYHSHIIEWRKARDASALAARQMAEQPEARRGKENEPAAPRRRRHGVAGTASPARRRRHGASSEHAELEQLRRQNEKLARDLARTQAALEIMGKAHAYAGDRCQAPV